MDSKSLQCDVSEEAKCSLHFYRIPNAMEWYWDCLICCLGSYKLKIVHYTLYKTLTLIQLICGWMQDDNRQPDTLQWFKYVLLSLYVVVVSVVFVSSASGILFKFNYFHNTTICCYNFFVVVVLLFSYCFVLFLYVVLYRVRVRLLFVMVMMNSSMNIN